MNIYHSFLKPFPVIAADGVMPEDLLSAFLRHDHIQMKSSLRDVTGNNKDSDKRAVLKLLNDGKPHPAVSAAVITGVIDMCAAFHNRLAMMTAGSIGDYDEDKLSIVECWDDVGYENSKHVDSQKKIWTGVVYFFGDGLTCDGGTTFFDGQERKLGQEPEIYTAAPSPNRACWFYSGPDSLHAVHISPVRRHVLILNYNEKV